MSVMRRCSAASGSSINSSSSFWSYESIESSVSAAFRSMKRRMEPFDLQEEVQNNNKNIFEKQKQDKILVSSLSRLAGKKLKEGKLEEALAVLDELLSIQRSYVGENHPAVASTIHAKGIAFSRMGKIYEYEALTAFEDALRIQQDTLGSGHALTARTANNMWMFFHNIREEKCRRDSQTTRRAAAA